MRSRKLGLIFVLIAILALGLLAGSQLAKMGNTQSPSTPENTLGYSLEDVYDRLDTGTAGALSTFTEPAAPQGTGTMHTIDQIMALIPDHKDSFDGAEGVREVPIPDGIYEGGKTATAVDSDLIAENILAGVEIFDVEGSYERFTDNGNGTVTDSQTGLMWVKDADSGAQVDWWDAKTFATNEDAGGHADWRLPQVWELYTLVDEREGNPSLQSDHPFDGVRNAEYWSETKYEDFLAFAYYVRFSDGWVDYSNKGMPAGHVWCVR